MRAVGVGSAPLPDPLLADSPLEAAVSALTQRPICALEPGRPPRSILAEQRWVSPTQLDLEVRPGLRFGDGSPLGAVEIARSLLRARGAAPYRALLAALKPGTQGVAVAAPTRVSLFLSYPFPELALALCHPTLAIVDGRYGEARALGPFHAPAEHALLAFEPGYPGGRPYLDKWSVSFADARGAQRLFAQDKARLVLGGPEGAAPGQSLYATYLSYQRARVGERFRAAIESAIDRADLTRHFVRAPADPLDRLLPAALLPLPTAPVPTGPRPPRVASARDLSLLFDLSREDLRSVAERLQIKLHDLGLSVSLRGLTRAALRERARDGDYDLLLQSALLPPSATSALALVLELAHRSELISTVLPALGATVDAGARASRVAELITELAPTLDLIPLYTERLRVRLSPQVAGLDFDAQGLPALDALFLTAP